jgi:hypothetical protein
MPIKLAGLAGLAGSGKGACADYLVQRHGFVRVKFAGPLKAMLRALLREMDVGPVTIERMIEGNLKEVPSPYFNGFSPRHAMQTLGTEWGRDLIGEDFWVDAWRSAVSERLKAGSKVVVDDCRFGNEARMIWRLGGVLLSVVRPDVEPVSAHVSETMPFVPNHTIENVAGLEDLYSALRRTLDLPDPQDNDPHLLSAVAALES